MYAFGVKILNDHFLLGVGYLVSLCVQQKNKGTNVRLWGGRGGGVGGRGRVGAWGVGVRGVVGQKLKKLERSRKNQPPPLSKKIKFTIA